MTLVPYDPFRQLGNMRREFDRFFSDFPFPFQNELGLGNIRTDVYETENEMVVTCDIPGLEKKEDVHIDIENNTLNISGTIKRANEVKDERMFRKERFEGRFQRTIALPSVVSQEGVKASYKNGVLEVKIPKQTDSSRKRIEVDFH